MISIKYVRRFRSGTRRKKDSQSWPLQRVRFPKKMQHCPRRNIKIRLANYQYPSVSYELADQIKEQTGADVRVTVPGHTQRGGSPVPYDRVLSTRLGARAAKLIVDEEYGYMVGIVNGETCKVPLGEVAGKLKMVDPNSGIIEEAKMIGISFGD